MVWPFGGKKKGQSEQPQGPDYVGALRSVAAQVLAGHRGFVALQGLPRFGVTERELVAWLRGGNGREVLTLGQWEKLAVAEVEGLGRISLRVSRVE